MSTYSQRQIVLIPFPFSDLSGKKVRPVLILSNDQYNLSSPDILVCGLTTNLKRTPYSVLIKLDDVETMGSLRHMSKIKVDTIASIENKLLIKSIATLKIEVFEMVIYQINKLINLRNK